MIVVLIAGLLSAASAWLARRANRGAGFLAAAPVTPTLAVLGHQLRAVEIVQGLPVVAAVTVLLVVSLRWQGKTWSPPPALSLLFGVPLVVPLARFVPLAWLGPAIVIACIISDSRLPLAATVSRRLRLPWPVAGVLGAAAFLVLWLAMDWVPALAPLFAMAPLLLIVSLAGVHLTLGRERFLAVGRAALGANVAITAFALVPSRFPNATEGFALMVAWCAYAAVAGLWIMIGGALRGKRPGHVRFAVVHSQA